MAARKRIRAHVKATKAPSFRTPVRVAPPLLQSPNTAKVLFDCSPGATLGFAGARVLSMNVVHQRAPDCSVCEVRGGFQASHILARDIASSPCTTAAGRDLHYTRRRWMSRCDVPTCKLPTKSCCIDHAVETPISAANLKTKTFQM